MAERSSSAYAENAVDKAIREAEEACQFAIASTPEPYRGFITLINQNKRVGGSRQSPQYATTRLPYMTVDGRIKMARDEHRVSGSMLTIQTTFEPVGDYMVCKAIVTSAMLGTAVGHAVVNFGGSGVDASNPIENGESSAIGRALGALGYGLFGTGVASADEVLAAMSEQTRQRIEAAKPPAEPVASEGQMGLLYGKLKACGVKDGHKRALLDFAYGAGLSKQGASELIALLDGEHTLPPLLRIPYVRFLVKTYGLDRKAVGEHMGKTFNHHDPTLLDPEQFLALIEWMIADSENDPEPDDIYLPGESGESVQPMTVPEWMEYIKATCESCNLSVDALEKWAIAQFGNGTVNAMVKLPREVYNSIRAMDEDRITQEVHAFLEGKQPQEALPY